MELIFLIPVQVFVLFSIWVLVRADFVRLTRPAARVEAVVTGHRSMWTEGGRSYAPIYRFASEGAEHQVTEVLFRMAAAPPLGTAVSLRHPEGRPDLARVPRLVLWIMVYGVLVGLEVVLAFMMLG